MKGIFYLAATSAAVLAGTAAGAQNIYNQGFETDTSGWVTQGTSTITRVASGGGVLGVSSATGSFHAEITNSPGSYGGADSGLYGVAGYTRFGQPSAGAAYPGSPYTKQVSVYINTQTAAPSQPGSAFWIDASPSSATSAGEYEYGAEHNFHLSYTGTAVNVGIDSDTSALTLDTSGWYTFQFEYGRNGPDTALSLATLRVLAGSTVLNSTSVTNTSPGGPSQNEDIGGTGYLWFTLFQNGFSGDRLAIDDVRADLVAPVPEPATWAMMILGFGVVGAAARRRKSVAIAA